jgi:hypothetical protein
VRAGLVVAAPARAATEEAVYKVVVRQIERMEDLQWRSKGRGCCKEPSVAGYCSNELCDNNAGSRIFQLGECG